MIGNNSGAQIKSFIERVERIEQEMESLSTDRKEIYAEAKSLGFEVYAIKQIVKMRKEDEQKRREKEEILETYLSAIGDFINTPLGAAGKP